MFGDIAKAYAVARIIPYIEKGETYLANYGIGQREILFLVENDISLYENYIPLAWKKALPLWIEKRRSDFVAYVDIDELIADPKTYLALFLTGDLYKSAREYLFEAVRTVTPWLEPILLSPWFEGELERAAIDVRAARKAQAV